MQYDFKVIEPGKVARIKATGLAISVSKIIGKIFPTVEEYFMKYLPGSSANAVGYYSVSANEINQNIEKYVTEHEKKGNQFVLLFAPNNDDMSPDTFEDLANSANRRIYQKTNELHKAAFQ